jgi:ATP-dependent RNA helicase SUPV3L1/SUV3
VNTSDKTSSKPADLAQLDTLTGGAFTAPTSGERAARLREWLASEPAHEAMADVYRELSHRDKGAAKALKEKLDELKRAKAQDAIAEEWAIKARALLDHPRLNLADAMGWQRDAAKAGAPLSREPLLGLKLALAERMKAVEDLQHRLNVEREAAVLLAQRIEVLSTKPWTEAQAVLDALRADVQHWQQQAQALSLEPVWASLDPKYPSQLDTSRNQLLLVWEAFDAALAQALAAAADPSAPLPAVPVWADALRALRGEAAPAPAVDSAELHARQAQAGQAVKAALDALTQTLTEGHTKAAPKAAAELRQVLKDHGRYIDSALEAQAQAALKQAGELEGWQKWRADQLREELLAKAVALTQAPEGQRLGGRKMQEALRGLREQWKATDQGGVPNHALWKKFDEACNLAHKEVEAWLGKLKEQTEASRGQRLALIEEVQAWAAAHANSTDWKAQVRDLHAFAERWRQSGHLSEKLFAELQPLWKAAMAQAHAPLEGAQSASLERRQALIQEAQDLGAAPLLRIDAVKALQQRWQQEAHSVPLDRRQEQKLWEAFRQPIDEAFERKSAEREKTSAALNAHDKAVLEASRALEAASAGGDALQIRRAMEALQAALRGELPAPEATAPVEPSAEPPAETSAANASDAPTEAAGEDPEKAAADPETESAAAPPPPVQPAKKLVAMRGDDRPGMQRPTPAPARPGGRDGKGADRRDARMGAPGRDAGSGRGFDRFGERPDAPRGPRLGDAAFRAQRQAIEQADLALRKLAAQAHGEVLTHFMTAWETRDPNAVPTAQALGAKAVAAGRAVWMAALQAAPSATTATQAEQSLLRLEMAAEVPTPAEHQTARRALQLQLLTRRNDPAPAATWVQDVGQVLGSGYDAAGARRLQTVLKVLLRR